MNREAGPTVLARLGVLLGASVGVMMLFVGVVLLNQFGYAKPVVHVHLFRPSSPDEPPDILTYHSGLFLAIGGAWLFGFSVGRGLRRPRPRPNELLILE